MRDKLTPRQAQAWSLCTISVPAAMALCGAGWIWVLLGASAAATLCAVLRRMQRRSGMTLERGFLVAFGTHGGRAVAAVELLWLVLAAAGAARACQSAFGEELGPFGPAAPLFLAALMSRKGKVGAARVCGVVVLVLTILYSILVLGAVRQVQWDWCAPKGMAADGASALGLCLAPVAVLFFAERDELPPRAWGCGVISAVVPALLAFLTAACLSPELARSEALPLLTLSKSLSVLAVMRRFEVLLSVAQLLGLVMLLAALACAGESTSRVIVPKWEDKACSGAFCLVAFGVGFVLPEIPTWLWAAGAATFWGFVPVLTQFIGNIKKSEKI